MWTVSATLAPAALWGVYAFGIQALGVLLVSIAASMLTEAVFNLVQRRRTLRDGSAFLTGFLIGLNMPPSVPAFVPVLACVFAIAVVKQTFGGLGRNWMNPALAGRVFATFSWTGEMTTWTTPRPTLLASALGGSTYDAVSGATPLVRGSQDFLASAGYWDLAMGNIPGCIGEVSAVLLVLGAIVMLALGIISWHIPVSYIATFLLLGWALGGLPAGLGMFAADPLFHLLSGGLMLGALYMATDMVTSPMTARGMVIFGMGCGLLTFLIRFFGGFPEGVSLAIILMNTTVPLINRATRPVTFGTVKEASE
jgi:electron transport complex protein RnfD